MTNKRTSVRLIALSLYVLLLLCGITGSSQERIDRMALVQRHNVINKQFDSLSALTLGNGGFAFTVDVTGMQSFPEAYSQGVPLGTQSEWAWHSFVDTAAYRFEESLKAYHLDNRDITYAVQWNTPERNKGASDWFRQNVHRLQLGNLGMLITLKNGTTCSLSDVKGIDQELDLWNGIVKSHFTIEGTPVDVITAVHPETDVVSVKISSALIKEGRIKLRVRFPYPTGTFSDVGVNRQFPEKHSSRIIDYDQRSFTLEHVLDKYRYYLKVSGSEPLTVTQLQRHDHLLTPAATGTVMEYSFRFSEEIPLGRSIPNFGVVRMMCEDYWQHFWQEGGAVDFSGSTDPRATELERRIILSQYLMAVQCAGNIPPQETGLTYNSWFGKPHLEMHWWHAAHFALWNRPDMLEKCLQWYYKVAEKAAAIAKRQGYEGLRWQKMTDPAGNESPSSVGAFLIWQQPHFIYMTELLYRHYHDKGTLNKYKDLVFATADFMASYPTYDSSKHRYTLGPGMIPAQERFKPESTFNPTFELAYWRWGLSTAQEWRVRLGLPRNQRWDNVLDSLSALPQQQGLYLAAESAPDAYTNPPYMTDHPAVLGALGMLPARPYVDTAVMHNTFNKIWQSWNWKETWGWDFPLTAMTATRLGLPDKAMDALFMPVKTNTWLPNGHNYQDERLRLYLPGNGGLLTAIAVMCAGYDGCNVALPGIPDNGKWHVMWEGLNPMP
ncbi:hypothetical protein [Chitinophaga pinensis]|uniref:Glycoside hydrolase family 65 n=1 Tax=Chitinophaga pinensis (strain ATCC 43595 / DSM 2588 / LMG 13176 / NBRC 15968 / NCIMB 11800 / UQM 2034) TaxID=485918 RepID=A0A979GP43_CHIPD|nr:hypothetical protein [Chitinophaga pinensis]ACU59073.1 conserved hypothetical protein [Chitinophaga pinensis DSM 2588]